MLLQWVTLKAAKRERVVARLSGDDNKGLDGCDVPGGVGKKESVMESHPEEHQL